MFVVPLLVMAQENTVRHLFTISELQGESLLLPTDVASANDSIYIVDSGHNRIVKFDVDGKFIKVIGKEGSGEGEFKDPVGIFVDNKGYLYVADTANHRIQIFDSSDKFSSMFSLKYGDYQIRPIDVAVDPVKGHIYVTGNNNHKLMVFDQQGKLLRQWGKNGSSYGEFRYPATIDLMNDNRIAVVDVLNTRVQLFNRDGDFLTEVGQWGVLPGQLFRPKGVAIDEQNRIYISDSYMNVIQVFQDNGQLINVLEPPDGYQFQTPVGMTVDGRNRLYVTEMLKQQVSVFQLE